MISLITGALAPGLALLSFIYLRDKYEPEPLRLLLKMFILGMVLVFPAYVLGRTIQEGLNNFSTFSSLIIIALLEEFLKWFILYYMIFKNVEFNEPYDGIVYAGAVSIGFATIENIGYILLVSSEPSTILLRSFVPVSGHALFGILMGYLLGQAKFSNKEKEKYLLIYSLIFPSFLHATFNFILFQNITPWFYLMVPFLIVFWIYGLSKMKRAVQISPFSKK